MLTFHSSRSRKEVSTLQFVPKQNVATFHKLNFLARTFQIDKMLEYNMKLFRELLFGSVERTKTNYGEIHVTVSLTFQTFTKLIEMPPSENISL